MDRGTADLGFAVRCTSWLITTATSERAHALLHDQTLFANRLVRVKTVSVESAAVLFALSQRKIAGLVGVSVCFEEVAKNDCEEGVGCTRDLPRSIATLGNNASTIQKDVHLSAPATSAASN